MVTRVGMIRRQTVEGVAANYDEARRKLAQAFDLLGQVGEIMASFCHETRTGFLARDLSDFTFRQGNAEGRAEELRKCYATMRANVWNTLVDLADVRRCMSLRDQTALEAQLHNGTLPEITVENVEAWVSRIKNDLPGMIDRAVGEVFNELRPRHHEAYATNRANAFKIGRRVIHGWSVENWTGTQLRLNYRAEPFYRALEASFCLLDGKVPPKYPGDAVTAIREALNGGAVAGETEYFRWKAFQNGNMHLEFKRADLLERLNVVGGRGQTGLNSAA